MLKHEIAQKRRAFPNSNYFIVFSYLSILAVSQHFKPIGCFKDATRRSFPKLIANFRSEITNWSNFEEIIKSCSKLSRQKGYRYFGIQFYGECWSGEHVEFDGEGFSLRCVSGVGKAGSNFVYENIASQGNLFKLVLDILLLES